MRRLTEDYGAAESLTQQALDIHRDLGKRDSEDVLLNELDIVRRLADGSGRRHGQ
jgi:hypothetical protein